jgi:myo-inositol-1(or 4)-monophosphatase
MSQFLEVAVDAAREAGAILLAEYGRPQKFSYKGEVDIVTESDRRSEQAIVARLRSHFPRHLIVGEEGAGKDGAGKEATASAASGGPRHCWYIDPLDGTTNFAHGYPCFAVSIGLAENVVPGTNPLVADLLAAVVYNPVSQELFTAERGDGAYLNQKRIHVSQVERLAEGLLATGFPVQKRTQNPNIYYYWDFTMRSHGVRRDGSAALDLAGVACGRFDGFWEFGLRTWDTAAGALLVSEAGGMVTDLAGKPYRVGGPDLLVSNTKIHAEMQIVARDIADRVGVGPG